MQIGATSESFISLIIILRAVKFLQLQAWGVAGGLNAECVRHSLGDLARKEQ